MDATQRLPRADEAERHLITCIIGWPERAHEILPLVPGKDFFAPLHQKIWRKFCTQLELTGEVDAVVVGKQLDCSDYLYEQSQNISTTAYAHVSAKSVHEAARARELHEVTQKAAHAILRGRPYESVIAQLRLAIEAFEGVA